ncbi:MAG: BREX-1 system adenine-specific DNA-methyltransferase PglX [Prevotella sp.]|nr:BREX-1 system adenine-specific DNA-methyltransferase PglX [Prevotella sp.]
MDTNRIKRFATEARNKLKEGIAAKIRTLGFDKKGNVAEEHRPQLMQGGTHWNGQLLPETFYHQWTSLYNRIQQKGISEVYEEAAYTWFNRLVAIRILQKNGIIEPVLTYVDEARTPKIVDDARSAGRIPPMSEADRQRLMELLDDDTKVTEQFAILISAYCHANPIIRQSFGRMADYTELLLPNNILAENGFIDDLNRMSSESNDELAQSLPSREGGRPEANHTEFITDEDYKSSELIGWLYQFYISERKDEVFAKKGKYDADEIAPATQIFTPHWIVEYMVQNTIGRIYLDWHPEATEDFVSKWKYLVPQSEPRDISLPSPLERGGGEAELTDLRFADLGCGSGHILGYMFDILFDLYIYEGYTRKEAVENILSHNITGVDLDLRAKQLATFALLLKACQKDESFRDGNVLPNVLTMPEPIADSDRHQLFHEFFKGEETNNILTELDDAFDLLKDAQTLGSIMKFNLSKSTLLAIRQTMDYWKGQSFVPDSVTTLLPSFRIILALTEKYTALVMNPPYMGSGRFDNILSKYVKDNYPTGKADLFAVFMLVAKDRLAPNGKYAMINMQSWMFLSSFEQLRISLLKSMNIDSMLHLGPHTFDELGGEVVQNVAYIVTNIKCTWKGDYYRLVEGKNCEDKRNLFLTNKDSHNRNSVHYPCVDQKDFERIPGCVIGYWLSQNFMRLFENHNDIDSMYKCREGIHTTDNKKYVKLWFEVSSRLIAFNCKNYSDVDSKGDWVPYNKGGGYRKWYGLNECIVAFSRKYREEMAALPFHVRPSEDLYFREGGTWSAIGTQGFAIRYYPIGFLFDAGGQVAVGNDILPLLGYLNSKLFDVIAKVTMPTINYKCGVVKTLPNLSLYNGETRSTVSSNIVLSKLDWDAHETSWDFAENPLVAIMKQAEGEEPVVSKEETGSFKPRNQQFLSEKPAVSKRETDSFAAENYCEQGEAEDDQAMVTPLPDCGNDITKPWYDDYHTAVTELEGMLHPTDGITTHGSTLELCVNAFEKLWTARFMQLHANEEELNRQFIDIYGLQDELTPDVPLNEITILQQGEISIE